MSSKNGDRGQVLRSCVDKSKFFVPTLSTDVHFDNLL